MIIRPAVAGDRDSIESCVDSNWADDKQWGPTRAASYATTERATVVVAELGSAVVGVASLLLSTRARFGIIHMDVATSHQQQGIGSALLGELRRRHPSTPAMIRVRPWDTKSSRFLRNHGFAVAERVIEGWLEPASQAMLRWVSDAIRATPASVTITPIESGRHTRRDIAGVIDSWYQRHHEWAPPRHLSIDEAVALYLDPSLPDTGHTAEVDGELVGAGVLLPDPFHTRPGGAHLVNLGVGAGGRPDEAAIVTGLFAACLQAANAQGRSVQVEVSNLHNRGWELVEALPVTELFEGLVIYVG